MDREPTTVSLEVAIENVLWRTRGVSWDYSFVLRPQSPTVDDCFALTSQVFGDLSPTLDETYRPGTLEAEDGSKVQFVGCCFVDESRKDRFGRPVVHYLILFLPDGAFPEERTAIPSGFGREFVRKLAAHFDPIFNEGDAAFAPEGRLAKTAGAVGSVRIEGRPMRLRCEERLRAKKKRPVIPSRPPPQSTRVVKVAFLVLLFLLAAWLVCTQMH